MHFSSRVDISAPNPIAAAEAAAKANGIALSKLNDSNPTRHGLAPELVPSVYTADPRGPRAAREALAAFLNTAKAVDASSPQSTSPAASEGGNERHAAFNNANTAIEGVDPDALYLLSSTSEAYSWLIKLLCDAGDAVLAPKPGYPLIESIARLECVDTVEYQLQFDGSWFIDIAELERLLSEPGGERIRALVLINPNNPTGSYVKPTERARIVTLCREHGIALIADEVFFDYSLEPFPGNARLAGERGVLTFALDGFSKMLAAPAQTRRVGERVRNNLAKLHELLDADPNGLVSVLRAEGGWNVLLRVPSVIDENELVLRLIDEHKLTGQPGYFFDMTSNGYLAVSLLPEPDEFERGIRAVLNTVAALLR